MAKKKVEVELIFDSKGAVSAIKTADGQVLGLGKTVGKTDTAVKGLSNSVKLGLAAAFVGMAAAARKGFQVLSDSVQLAGVQQIAERKLEQALRNTGDASEESAAMLKGLATEVQRFSNFGDEAVITAQAMLLSFGEVGGAEGAALLTPRLADVAAGIQGVTGEATDLNTVSTALGKALSGGAGALTRYGISLTETQKRAFNNAKGLEKVRLLTEVLDSNFKGLAAATRDPFIQATNAVDDLKEALGSRLRPEIEKTADQFTQFLQDQSTVSFVEKISESILGMGQSVIQFFQFDVPIAMNNYRLKLAGIAKDVIEVHGNIAGAIFNPLKFFKGEVIENPFQSSIDELDSLRANAHDALVALVLLKQQQEKDSKTTTPTTTFGTGGAPASGAGEESISSRFADMELKRIDTRKQTEAVLTSFLENQTMMRRGFRREEFEEFFEQEAARKAALEARQQAMEAAVAQDIATTNTSIQAAGDAANAVIGSIRQIIQAKIAETIAKSIASIPFPANLVLGGVAAAGINLLFNKLIPQFADGVTNFGGGMALVGERGPELVNLPQGSNVITNENTEKLVNSINGTGGQSNDFSAALNGLAQSNRDAIGGLAENMAQMKIAIDYYSMNDGLVRHNKQQSTIGG